MHQPTTLEELLAKDAIRERLHDYVRAMDCIDDELGRSVFHADASADYGGIYRGTGHGFIDFVHAAHAGMLAHQHHLGSIGIVVQGDQAVSEAYVTVTLRLRAADGALQDSRSHGRYLDRWEKRAGNWAISARRYVHLFDDLAPVTLQQFPTEGSRDRGDPGYALFAGLRG
jgi:SnoaL-like domain